LKGYLKKCAPAGFSSRVICILISCLTKFLKQFGLGGRLMLAWLKMEAVEECLGGVCNKLRHSSAVQWPLNWSLARFFVAKGISLKWGKRGAAAASESQVPRRR